MSFLNPSTGMWEDDPHGPAPMGQPGALGAQVDTPQTPAAPPPPAPAPMPAPPPALPTVAPYAPAPPVAVPPSRVVSPAESQTLGSIDANVAAKAGTEQQAGQLGVVKAGAQEAAAAREQDAVLKHQQAQQKIIDEAAARATQLQATAKQQWDQYRSMGVKDPEASESFGHSLLAALAIGLGEYSSKMNGGPNRAAELIASANARNIALQKEAIAKKYREAELAGGDITAAKAAETEALRNLDLKHSALLDASAAKLKTELSRMGVPQAQIDANQTVQATEAAALEKREAVNASIRKDTTSLAEADMRATTAAHALAAKKHGAGGGAGGGPTRLQLSEAKDIGGEMEKHLSTLEGVKGLAEAQHHLAGSIDAVKQDPSNPVNVTNLIDGMIRTNTGRAAIKAQYDLYVSHAGGTAEKFDSWLQSAKDGNLGEGVRKNLLSSAEQSLAELDKRGGEENKKFHDAYDNDPRIKRNPEAQAKYAAIERQTFGGMRGYGKPAGNAAPTPAAPDRRALAQKAIDDPNAPPAVKARALQILRGQ